MRGENDTCVSWVLGGILEEKLGKLVVSSWWGGRNGRQCVGASASWRRPHFLPSYLWVYKVIWHISGIHHINKKWVQRRAKRNFRLARELMTKTRIGERWTVNCKCFCFCGNQLLVKNCHEVLVKNTAMAQAGLNRLAKTPYRFELTSDNMRNNRIFAASGLKR